MAVGGGVVSDIVGFAAAIVLRGVAWNAVPTTTGSMTDAAIGGKTGVDTAAGKNLLGAFHPPRTILIDPTALETLSARDYRAGLVEGFKASEAWPKVELGSKRLGVEEAAAILDRIWRSS